MSKTTDIAVSEATGSAGIAELVRQMLVQLGEDPNREGLQRTPERFEKALRYLTSGDGYGFPRDTEEVENPREMKMLPCRAAFAQENCQSSHK